MASDIVSRQLFLSRDNFSVSDFVSRQPLLSRDNFFVSNLVSRQRVRPSRDNKKDKLQQKRQPTAVYPAEGKLRQDNNSRPRRRSIRSCVLPPESDVRQCDILDLCLVCVRVRQGGERPRFFPEGSKKLYSVSRHDAISCMAIAVLRRCNFSIVA